MLFVNIRFSNYQTGNWIDEGGPQGRGAMRGGRGRGGFRDGSTDFNTQRNRFVYRNAIKSIGK